MWHVIFYMYVWLVMVLDQVATIAICKDEFSDDPCEKDTLFKWVSRHGWRLVFRYALLDLLWPITKPVTAICVIVSHKNKK